MPSQLKFPHPGKQGQRLKKRSNEEKANSGEVVNVNYLHTMTQVGPDKVDRPQKTGPFS